MPTSERGRENVRRFAGYSVEVYSEDIEFLVAAIEREASELKASWHTDARRLPEFAARARRLLNDSVELLMLRYSRGDDWQVLAETVRSALQWCPLALEISERHESGSGVIDLTDYSRDAARLLAFSLATGVDAASLRAFVTAVRGRGLCGLWDRWVTQAGLDPAGPIAPTAWKHSPYEPLVRALDAEASNRSALVERYLSGWRQRIRPYPWSADDRRVGSAGFGLWSFEVACSVMIFGIEDETFRKHKDYPQEVVDRFRLAGSTLMRPSVQPRPSEPLPVQVERRPVPDVGAPLLVWLTMVTDGTADAIDAAMSLWPPMVGSYADCTDGIDALAALGWAIRVDWKDAPGASGAARLLAENWGLPEYLSSLDRSSVDDELEAFSRWLTPLGIALAGIETDADEYAAVAVRESHLTRWLDATQAIGLTASVIGR